MTTSIRLLLATAFALAITACAGEPNSTVCATGITCPEGTKCAAAQEVCITNDCGDGIVQASEVCDDGNIINGDGCTADCRSREACGDNVLNAAAGELCDDGNTTGGDGCAADCRSVEICGNGIRDVNEACDDGNTVPGDGCSGNCKSTEICGNGIVDLNEKCDDANAPGGCNDDCQGGTGCGDGHIDISGAGIPLEECDDGNTDDHDDCRNNCHLNFCGDGNVQSSGSHVEDCDTAGESASCNLDCTNWACGDGKINKAKGEECDLGTTSGVNNNADDKACTLACKKNVCGDMAVFSTGVGSKHEDCDDGDTDNFDGCSNICTTPHCGNGVVEMGEACDDGNMNNGDGCTGTTCQFETCGDGVKNDNGEFCDKGVGGVATEDPTCDVDCTQVICGDGITNQAANEECDDPANPGNMDPCKDDCTLNFCGDGFPGGPGEECDDMNTNNFDGCTEWCTLPLCHNGIRDMGEECDDGNSTNTDTCVLGCKDAICGDGVTWSGVEQCDNGTSANGTVVGGTNGNGTSNDCTPSCKTNICGDTFVDTEGTGTPQTEACDLGAFNGQTTCPYGTPSCPICTNNCDTAGTGTGPFCGDGNTDSANGEGCDDRSPTQSCGQCSNGCNAFTAAAQATGIIIAGDSSGGNIHDGDTITLDDGFNTGASAVVLEFDKDTVANVVSGHVRIDVSGGSTLSDGTVRDRINSAINTARGLTLLGGKGLRIDHTNLGNNGILLTHDQKTSKGNRPLASNGLGADFFVSAAMTGGAAGDCTTGQPCDVNEDCLSPNSVGNLIGSCQSHVCQ